MELLIYSMPHILPVPDACNIAKYSGMNIVDLAIFRKPVRQFMEIVIQTVLLFRMKCFNVLR